MADNTALEVYTPEKQREVLALLGISGPANQIQLLFHLGEKYHLDILNKEIHLIPGKGPFIGVWGRTRIAHRSGMLDGLELDDEFETDTHWCCRAIVWRKDMRHPAAKVIGRVGRHEKKDWPLEIARARALRAGLGYAFSIHDSFDIDDLGDEDGWVGLPDERVTATGVIAGPDQEEVKPAESAPAKRRRANKKTGEVQDVSPAAAQPAPDVEPPTVVVGGHTLAQKIAMAAKDAGIDDDETRWDVISAATGGHAGRGKEVTEEQAPRVLEAFQRLQEGALELRYSPEGTPRLVWVRTKP